MPTPRVRLVVLARDVVIARVVSVSAGDILIGSGLCGGVERGRFCGAVALACMLWLAGALWPRKEISHGAALQGR
eukprot:12915113-Prorocentrum_lima.AAC.1